MDPLIAELREHHITVSTKTHLVIVVFLPFFCRDYTRYISRGNERTRYILTADCRAKSKQAHSNKLEKLEQAIL